MGGRGQGKPVRYIEVEGPGLDQYAFVGTVLSRCSLDDFDQAFSCKSDPNYG